MPVYKQPLQPFDPIVQETPEQQAQIRYLVDSFSEAGQDSHTFPPSQDPTMFESLRNIMPVRRGAFEPRWGRQAWNATVAGTRCYRPYVFQRDTDGLRALIFSNSNTPIVFNEDGSVYRSSLIFPSNGVAPRIVVSRSYAYMFDGLQGDLRKWNGDATGGISNIGIDVNNVTPTNSMGSNPGVFGPMLPGTASQAGTGAAWTNVNNIKTDGSGSATCLIPGQLLPPFHSSEVISASNFSFAVAGSAVKGIAVSVTGFADDILSAKVTCQLVRAGVLVGTGHSAFLPGSSATLVLGGPSDLWGDFWQTSDFNTSNFGVNITCTSYVSDGTAINVSLDNVKVTVYVVPSGSNATTSGQGVGVQAGIAGDVTLTVGRIYYLAFKNSQTGHYSDLTVASNSTGPTSGERFPLLLAVHNDTQVDRKTILATADGGDPSILYTVRELNNSTTTFTDDTPETTLLLQQPLLFTDEFGNEFGVTANSPPPVAGTVAIKHKGRVWMAQNQQLFFSKSTDELTLPDGFIAGKYEEAWPGDNSFDISEGAENVTGLLSDGNVLYIGTERHVRRLFGDSPANFQEPEIVCPETGVLNQEVWKLVFAEGTPVGAIWLTPDLKVIASDFNTYIDIGEPIQDILNDITPSAAALVCNAEFVTDGEYDLYILGIPRVSHSNNMTSSDTLCVYDLRAKKWFIWDATGGIYSILFNVTATGAVQWIVAAEHSAADTKWDIFTPLVNDNGTDFTQTVRTSWLHMGAPTVRKLLDEIELITDHTDMTVTVEGASDSSHFTSPDIVISNAPLKTSPFGQLKVYLASRVTKHRYYRFTLTSTQTGSTKAHFLSGYNIRGTYFNSL